MKNRRKLNLEIRINGDLVSSIMMQPEIMQGGQMPWQGCLKYKGQSYLLSTQATWQLIKVNDTSHWEKNNENI